MNIEVNDFKTKVSDGLIAIIEELASYNCLLDDHGGEWNLQRNSYTEALIRNGNDAYRIGKWENTGDSLIIEYFDVHTPWITKVVTLKERVVSEPIFYKDEAKAMVGRFCELFGASEVGRILTEMQEKSESYGGKTEALSVAHEDEYDGG